MALFFRILLVFFQHDVNAIIDVAQSTIFGIHAAHFFLSSRRETTQSKEVSRGIVSCCKWRRGIAQRFIAAFFAALLIAECDAA
jgi:hypothetical protein